jgi:hypothetical protein
MIRRYFKDRKKKRIALKKFILDQQVTNISWTTNDPPDGMDLSFTIKIPMYNIPSLFTHLEGFTFADVFGPIQENELGD